MPLFVPAAANVRVAMHFRRLRAWLWQNPLSRVLFRWRYRDVLMDVDDAEPMTDEEFEREQQRLRQRKLP